MNFKYKSFLFLSIIWFNSGNIVTGLLLRSGCQDLISDCQSLQQRVNICSDPKSAQNVCPLTCGMCPTPPTQPLVSSNGCKDRLNDCAVLQQRVQICSSRVSAQNVCPMTCKLCPINGGWSNWGSYGACSKSCDGGTQTRSRLCNNPSPSGGGSSCSGSYYETTPCNTQQCAVNGGWSAWRTYGACSKSCGSGTKTRSRLCNNPSPANGGSVCSGSYYESTSCNTQQCSVDGGWTNWVSYGSCSKSCGDGTQVKQRTCTNPRPSGSGQQCSGSSSTTVSCNIRNCPYPEGWSSWGAWGGCSTTCGSGTQQRSRNCMNPYNKRLQTVCPGNAVAMQFCSHQRSCPSVYVPIHVARGCGSGWTENSGYCYIMVDTRKTFDQALGHCHSMGATLAEPNTRSKNDFIRRFLIASERKSHYSAKYAWLGAKKSGGQWRWLTSGSITYTDWESGESNNRGGDENCIEMGYQRNYHWNDQECSDTRTFICQKSM